MFEFFISYSTEDVKVALKVCAKLEERGIRCWMAPRDVPPGMEYAEAIVDALNETHTLVLIFSSSANESRQVKAEVQGAFESGKTIIPFRIENVPPSGTMRHFIRSFQWIDAFGRQLDLRLEELANKLQQQRDALLEGPSKAAAEKPPVEKPIRRTKRLRRTLTVVSLLLIAGIVLFLIYRIINPLVTEDKTGGISAAEAAQPLILTNGGRSDVTGGILGIDGSHNVYIAGFYSGTTTIGAGPNSLLVTSQGESDAYLMQLDPTGSLQWVKILSNSDTIYIHGLTVDSSGNVYIAGSYRDSIDLDPDRRGGPVFTSQGDFDAFVVKLDSSGTSQWARSWGGPEYDNSRDIILDDFRNIYIIGHFEGSTDLDPSSAVLPRISKGNRDAYVMKLDPDGMLQWANTWGGPELDEALGITVDSSGSCYIAGHFKDTVSFSEAGKKYHSQGDFDAYILKFDAAGALQLARTWGGTDRDSVKRVILDDSGNIYLGGTYRGAADFNPGSGTLLYSSEGKDDVYVIKLDPNFSLQWARAWGGPGVDNFSDLVLGRSNNLHIIGGFMDSANLGSGIETYTSRGTMDPFLVELDTSGSLKSVRTWGGLDNDTPTSIIHDDSGNFYITGIFGGTADLDPGPKTAACTAQGNTRSLYVIKIDPSESLQWIHSWGTFTHNYIRGLAVDNSYDIYAAGYIEGSVDLDPGPGIHMKTAQRYDDAFLLKLDPTGAHLWSYIWGGSEVDQAHGVAIDNSGHVIATGHYMGMTDLNPGPGNHPATAQSELPDSFLSMFDESGSLQWARAWGGAGDDQACRAAIDNSGNIFILGQFYGEVDLDPGDGKLTYTSTGMLDAYLTKFDPSGSLLWAKAWGGSIDHRATDIAIDEAGNIYTLGYFTDNIDLDPGTEIHMETALGVMDSYLLRLDSSGAFDWMKVWGGKDQVYARGIALDGAGNIYIVGHFEGSPDFNPGPELLNLPSQGDSDSFLIKLDSRGSLEWGRSWGGPDYDEARDIAYGTKGHLFVVGFFQRTTDLDPGPGTYLRTAQGCDDDYIIKLDMDGNLIQ